MSFNLGAAAVAGFKSLLGLFGGGGSTKDPPVTQGQFELKSLQEKAEKQKSVVECATSEIVNPKKDESSQPTDAEKRRDRARETLQQQKRVVIVEKFDETTKKSELVNLPVLDVVKEIARLTDVNKAIERKVDYAVSTPDEKSKNVDTVAVNSEEIRSLLVEFQEDDDEAYLKEETRRFQQLLSNFKQSVRNEEEDQMVSKECVQSELSGTLMRCVLTDSEALHLFPGIDRDSYEVLKSVFNAECLDMAKSSISQFTDSWLPDLKLPKPVLPTDRVKYKENEKFFKRTACCLQALRAYTVFQSPEWRKYKSSPPPLNNCGPNVSQ